MTDTLYPRYGRLRLDVAGNGSLYVVEPFYFEWAADDPDVIYPGLTTDLASVHLAGLWIDPWGPWTKPAVVHDRDYRLGQVRRKVADTRFYDGLKVQGAGWFKRNAMYAVVRATGWIPWRRYRQSGRSMVRR